jgi:acetyl/propionyl-CoA carboxylase alpha subunit
MTLGSPHHRTISCILVANRGEIACRIMRTARALGIRTVAVHSDADADSPHVAQADVAVHLPGNSPADTYLRGDLLVAAARAAGADAVHPGYGFLSERAGFAQEVLDAGLVWIGPSPAAIAAMGSKLASKDLMRNAGVPVLPEATVRHGETDALIGAARDIGYPVLVKASAGGGGRGMRVVRSEDELVAAVEGATSEAASAFGDGTVFLERYVEGSRHVEVQVMADTHGACVSLFERECSIQRRHQKIIEESPSPAVSPGLRSRLGQAAVAAASAVGYVGAGTVEFLLDANGEFFFLEMNTRLQVEHPVTELVTGLDLVALQISVAEGHALHHEALSPRLNGHAIEARLYAEDPAHGYLPSTGTIHRFDVPERPHLRVDSGIVDGSVVSPFYDPMLAKVIVWAPTRTEAIRALAGALDDCRIHGVVTNRGQLVEVLRHPEFVAGNTDTGFLERHPCTGAPTADTTLSALAAALAVQARHRAEAPVLAGMPSGWRNNPSSHQQVTLVSATGEHLVEYSLDRAGRLVHAAVDGAPIAAALVTATPHTVRLQYDGVSVAYDVHLVGDAAHVDSPHGSVSFAVAPRFALPDEAGLRGSLIAPMPGSIVRVLTDVGAAVQPGQALVVIEAMKMEHEVVAPTAGEVLEVHVSAGQQVDSGQPLLRLGTPGEDDGS